MYGMQAHGLCQGEVIKKAFKMFTSVEASIINARCLKLLGCSSVQNMNKIKCDPFKVQAYYR